MSIIYIQVSLPLNIYEKQVIQKAMFIYLLNCKTHPLFESLFISPIGHRTGGGSRSCESVSLGLYVSMLEPNSYWMFRAPGDTDITDNYY